MKYDFDYPQTEGAVSLIHAKSPLQAHVLAMQFPMMNAAEMADHIEDIKEHGQKEPIVLLNGVVLDGRNTLFACCELNRKPIVREFGDRPTDGESPADFVYSRNFHRRSLSPAQKAAVAVNYIPFLEAEAKARKQATQFKPAGEAPPAETADTPAGAPEGAPGGEEGAAPDLSGVAITKGSKKGRVTELVAKMFGTSTGMVKIAKRLKDQAPDLFDAVLNGTMKPGTADEELDKRNASKNESENKLKIEAERKDALTKIKETYPEKKFEGLISKIEEKKALKKHDDLLMFADIAKTRALPLIPLVKLGWSPKRSQEFLDGKIETASTVEDLLAAAVAQSKAKAGKPIEHTFTIITGDLGEYQTWTLVAHCEPKKASDEPDPAPDAQ